MVVYRQVVKEVDLDFGKILINPALAAGAGLAFSMLAYLPKTDSLLVLLILKAGLLSAGYLFVIGLLEKDEWLNFWHKYIRPSKSGEQGI